MSVDKIAVSGITIASDGKTISSSGGSWKVYTGTFKDLFTTQFSGSKYSISLNKPIHINFIHKLYASPYDKIFTNELTILPFKYNGNLSNNIQYLYIGEVKLGLSGTSADGGKAYVYIKLSTTSGTEFSLRADENNAFTLKNTSDITIPDDYGRFAIIHVFE